MSVRALGKGLELAQALALGQGSELAPALALEQGSELVGALELARVLDLALVLGLALVQKQVSELLVGLETLAVILLLPLLHMLLLQSI